MYLNGKWFRKKKHFDHSSIVIDSNFSFHELIIRLRLEKFVFFVIHHPNTNSQLSKNIAIFFDSRRKKEKNVKSVKLSIVNYESKGGKTTAKYNQSVWGKK